MALVQMQKTELEYQLDIFRALSEPVRVEMISLFDQNGQCACTRLAETLTITKSTISYHVRILSQAGLLEVNKKGRTYHYALRLDVFDYFVPGFLDRVREEHAAA